jgi:uncharacterized protein (DUF885 family)
MKDQTIVSSFVNKCTRLLIIVVFMNGTSPICTPQPMEASARYSGHTLAIRYQQLTLGNQSFATLRDSLTVGILNYEPEEFRMLGSRGAAGQLKDWSPKGIADEVAFCREALKQLDAFRLTKPEDILDQAVLKSHFAYLSYYYGQYHGEMTNLQISAYPYDLIEYELQRNATSTSGASSQTSFSGADHLTAVEGVLRGLPAYLNQQESNLITGLKFRAPDSIILEKMIDRIGAKEPLADGTIRAGLRNLDARLNSTEIRRDLSTYQIQSLHSLIGRADAAYARHARFLIENLRQHAKESWPLGKAEYTQRLALVYGYTGSLDDLVRPAEEDLVRIKIQMISVAHQLRPDLPQNNSLPARVLAELRKNHSSSREELLDSYKRVQANIDDRITKRMGLPAGAAAYIPAPPGVPVSPATNWPAPLLSRGSAIVLVDTSAEGLTDNDNVDLPWIAIHEGNPGHAAQSVFFHASFNNGAAPLCRFLNVPDEVGYVRGNWYAMANIEGWAFHTERLLLQSGLLSPEEKLAALSGQALRAARVVVDVRMHAGGWSRERGAQYLVTEADQSPDVAKREAYRYSRIPLQALSYYLGARQIEDLAARYGTHLGNNFEQQLLSIGPVPPSLIGTFLQSTTAVNK